MMRGWVLKLSLFRALAALIMLCASGAGSGLAQTDNASQNRVNEIENKQAEVTSSVAINQTDIGLQMQVKRIGLIDLDGVLRQSSGTSKVQQLLDQQRLTFQEEFTQREAELQAAERDLEAERELLSEEIFGERLKLFEDEVAEVQRQIQYRRQALDRAFQEAQRNLRGIALEIVKQIAGERKLDLVLSQESVLIFLPSLNISDEVLERLDERTKNARIEIKVGTDE